ncbi:MAG: phasin family protein [Pseudomonadales bacterium]|nr:phasin family protein [Pseudomonadales bacterium]MCP5185651.1 phasin family protein [Pseudomonadales bacterium]
MNPFEKTMQFGRDLMELNAEWFRKIAEFDGESVRKYIEVNQEFGKKLPEVRDVQSFLDLQRTYAETLWSNTQETFKARGELVKEAVEANTSVWRDAFQAAKPEAANAA